MDTFLPGSSKVIICQEDKSHTVIIVGYHMIGTDIVFGGLSVLTTDKDGIFQMPYNLTQI